MNGHFPIFLGTTIDHEPYEENDKSLVPCFVFHGKKPNYGKIFKKSTMILESLDISEEDMCIMGNVRVNFTNLQKVAACQRRVTIIAKYTNDDWVTSQETKAMIVKAQSHPALSHFITKGETSKFDYKLPDVCVAALEMVFYIYKVFD